MSNLRIDDVLSTLRARAPRTMHASEICAGLEVPKKRRAEVVELLDALVEKGLAQEMPGMRYRATAGRQKPHGSSAPAPDRAEGGQTRGRLIGTARGFAFVAAEDGGPDVFIPPDAVGPALHGDRVEIQTRRSPKGREGRVVQVLDRRSRIVTGVVRIQGRAAMLLPDDARLRGPMPVLGDAAPATRSDVTVVAEIVSFPQSKDEVPAVRIVEALGIRGATEVEVAKIKLREGVVEEFPDPVLAEARSFGTRVDPAEVARRADLRGIDLVTIDPFDARDHDDAVFVERGPAHGFHVVVAIADVSYYVREGTALDREALSRGTSIYLPDRAIPMLPPELSSHLASLVPNEDRFCLAVDVTLDAKGEVRAYCFVEGVMRSGGKLTYEGVAKALGLSEDLPAEPTAEARLPMLRTLQEAATLLRSKRLKRGALDFDLPEAKVLLDEDGEPKDAVRAKRDPGVRDAYRLIEEMMLLANEVVAKDLREREVPSIYRVHGKPDPSKLEHFATLASSLGHELDVESASDSRALSTFLRKIEPTPEAPVLRYLLLRSMQQALYSTTPDIGHFGLAAPDYLHFTSPIRRYPDLAVHRVLRTLAREEPIDAAVLLPKLRIAATESSRLERRAMVVERDVVDLYRAILVRDRVDDELDAQVTGVDENGFYCVFDEPFVEAWVPAEALGEELELDALGLRVTARRSGRSWALGDRVRVRIVEVRIQDRRVIVIPASQRARAPSPRAPFHREPARKGASRHGSKPKRTEGPRKKHAKGDSKRKRRR